MVKINIDMPKSCESCPLLCEDDNLDYCCCVDNSIDVDCEARAENCPLTPLEAPSNRCDSCTHSKEQDGSNCYECVKGIADNFEAQPTEMRDATEEERKSVKDYVESISKPTGFNFYEAQPCEDCISRSELLRHQHIIYDDDEEGYNAVYVKDIKALPSVIPSYNSIKTELKPCEDCISREEMLKYQEYLHGKMPNEENYKLWKFIKELPSVTPQPSEDAVSREAVEEITFQEPSYTDPYNILTEVREKVRTLKPVQPQRKRGKWNFIGYQMFECTSCRNVYTQDQFEALKLHTTDDLLPNCCPTCGSYNVEGGDEDNESEDKK